jgi:uncharacterized protein DUF1349
MKGENMPENMTLPIVLAITGSIALLIGLFGGGVKAKEIEVPKIPVGSRILSGLVGAILIWTAMRLSNSLPTANVLIATPIPTIESRQPQITTKSPAPTDAPTDIPTNPPTNTPTDLPPRTPLPVPTITPIVTIPVPEIISFTSPDRSNVLNNAFGWQQGNSSINTYNLTSQQKALLLIADGHTGQWGTEDTEPVMSYPIEGNFEAQVRLSYSPIWGHELAGIGIRAGQDHNTWLRLGAVYAAFSQGKGPEQRIVLDIDDHGAGNKIKTAPYSANTVYLKISRQGPFFDFFYSLDGNNWIALQTGYIADIPTNAELFLTIGSWGDGGVSGQFYDFQILRK